MSIPFLSAIVFGQWIAAETGIFPVSGWEPGLAGVKYLAFPVMIGIIAGLGSAVRFYRAVLLEEMHRDYIRTARATAVLAVSVSPVAASSAAIAFWIGRLALPAILITVGILIWRKENAPRYRGKRNPQWAWVLYVLFVDVASWAALV